MNLQPRSDSRHRESIAEFATTPCGLTSHAFTSSGEWLRRTGRRVESRSHLRTAFTLLSEIGCDAFAARAARELKLLGERGRSTPPAINDELTPQELQIAQLQLHLVLEQRPDLSRPNPDD